MATLDGTLTAAMSQLRAELVAGHVGERAAVLAVRDGTVVATAGIGSSAHRQVSLQPADVLAPVLSEGADTVVLIHTHTDESPPSAADHAFTRRLVAACAVVGVALATHLVITPTRSFVVTGARRPDPRPRPPLHAPSQEFGGENHRLLDGDPSG